MRWMWIDQILEHEPEKRMTAIKNVSMAEEHLFDHFAATDGLDAQPIMPASLMIEGMAQTAGILVGSVRHFKEKVILAKVRRARFAADVTPGQCLRYEATIQRFDDMGAFTTGIVRRFRHDDSGGWEEIGQVDLLFSHIDNNLAGIEFPEDNFVFADNFRVLLHAAGLEHLAEESE